MSAAVMQLSTLPDGCKNLRGLLRNIPVQASSPYPSSVVKYSKCPSCHLPRPRSEILSTVVKSTDVQENSEV